MPQISSVLVLVHYTAVCINLYNELCTILNGCIIVRLFAVAGDSVPHHCSLFCVGLKTLLFHPLPPPFTVCMEKMIHRDIEAICKILYGLSEESLLLCFSPEIFFLHCSQESHCIPAFIFVSLVCERFMQSQIYKKS